MFYGPLGTAVFSFTLATHVLHPILYAVPSNIYNAYGSCVLPCDTSCYSSTWCAHDECLTAASYRWQEPSLFPVLIKELSPKISRKLLIFVNLLRLCSVSGVYSIMSIYLSRVKKSSHYLLPVTDDSLFKSAPLFLGHDTLYVKLLTASCPSSWDKRKI
jgi:hypothetical protein